MDHEQIIKEQDEQLEEIESAVINIKNNARLINETIDEQKVYIKEMDEGMDKTQNQMNYAMDKLSTLLQTKNKGEIKCFITLLCISIILFLILIL
jgi:t-SNARE complex subunit (syntaxin)